MIDTGVVSALKTNAHSKRRQLAGFLDASDEGNDRFKV